MNDLRLKSVNLHKNFLQRVLKKIENSFLCVLIESTVVSGYNEPQGIIENSSLQSKFVIKVMYLYDTKLLFVPTLRKTYYKNLES